MGKDQSPGKQRGPINERGDKPHQTPSQAYKNPPFLE